MSTADLERLLRWEGAGGTWRILAELDGSVMVSLCRCDGGEEADRFTTDGAALGSGHDGRRGEWAVSRHA